MADKLFSASSISRNASSKLCPTSASVYVPLVVLERPLWKRAKFCDAATDSDGALLNVSCSVAKPARKAAMQRAVTVAGVTSVENQIRIIGEDGTCQGRLDDYQTKEKISFKSGKADLAETSFNTISMLAMIVRTCPTLVEVAGHTDSKGDAEVNLKLSQRRADKVAKVLVSHGVAPHKIVAKGYGELQPIADNATQDGRKANRRIELRVLGDAA